MSNLNVKLAFGFLLLSGLAVTLAGLAGQITGEGALTEVLLQKLGLHPDPDKYVEIGDILAEAFRRRARFTAIAGGVIAATAAYGLYVTSVSRPDNRGL